MGGGAGGKTVGINGACGICGGGSSGAAVTSALARLEPSHKLVANDHLETVDYEKSPIREGYYQWIGFPEYKWFGFVQGSDHQSNKRLDAGVCSDHGHWLLRILQNDFLLSTNIASMRSTIQGIVKDKRRPPNLFILLVVVIVDPKQKSIAKEAGYDLMYRTWYHNLPLHIPHTGMGSLEFNAPPNSKAVH
jgi:hypothetical protein